MECVFLCFEATPADVGVASAFWLDHPRSGPIAIVVSAFFAGIYAFFTIRSNRSMARKQATLALIERNKSTEYYQALSTAFLEIRRDRKNGFEQIKSPSNPQVREQRRKVLEYLNHYELIAAGIEQGALDESLYKAYRWSTVVRDWRAAADFVAHIRKPTPDSGADSSSRYAFVRLQRLAEKWEEQLKYREDGKWPWVPPDPPPPPIETDATKTS